MSEEIEGALKQFPNIAEVIGLESLKELEKADEKAPVVFLLKKTVVEDKGKLEKLFEAYKENPEHVGIIVAIDYYLRPYYILKHLDSNLATIKSENKLGVYITHLLDSKSFWQGYSEIEVAAYLKKLFGNVELEPNLPNGKSVDAKYSLNGQDYFVEVTVPKPWYRYQQKMEESAETGGVVKLEDSTDRACDKILNEVEHFKDLDSIKSIIVLNLNQAEFDEVEIEDCLMGVSKLVVLKEQATGKFVGTKVTREPWTAFDMDNRLQNIGLVLCYRREFALNGAVIFTKRLFVISFAEADYKPLEKLF